MTYTYAFTHHQGYCPWSTFCHSAYTCPQGNSPVLMLQLLLLCQNIQSYASSFKFFLRPQSMVPTTYQKCPPSCPAGISNFIYWKINSSSSFPLQLILLFVFSSLEVYHWWRFSPIPWFPIYHQLSIRLQKCLSLSVPHFRYLSVWPRLL